MSGWLGAAAAHLVLHEPGRVIQNQFLPFRGCVPGGQGQAAQSVTPSPPLLDHRHDLLLCGSSHGYASGADSHVVAAINDPLRGTLEDQNSYQRAQKGS